MNIYPKKVLSIQEQLQAYKNAEMIIDSDDEVLDLLNIISYYRLRGYSFPFYDKNNKKYKDNTKFSNILNIYYFDREFSELIFSILSKIEVALRVRFLDSLLRIYNDPLILYNPCICSDKQNYWKNLSIISSEIVRSNDVFIKHHLDNHDGQIPIWAIVEILSFGILSKLIKNMKTGKGNAFSLLVENYKFKNRNNKDCKPSMSMFSSWIHSCCILRNIVAHNSRIYNRLFSTKPEIIDIDKIPNVKFYGVYFVILAMKYLRPNDETWNLFFKNLKKLIEKYSPYIDLKRISFPTDWEKHLDIRL